MVRQLFHLGVIEAYTGVKKKKTNDEVFSCLLLVYLCDVMAFLYVFGRQVIL